MTITNVKAKQHIWYCSTTETLFTSSYDNLVTIGSMALPPSGATTGAAVPKPIQTSADSTSSSTIGIVSPTAGIPVSQTQSGLSPGAIAGIAIGVVCVLVIIAIIIYRRYRLNRKRQGLIQHVIDASSGPRNGNMSQKQPIPSPPIGGGPDTPQQTYTDTGSPGYVARSTANDPEDYLSPFEVTKRANAADAQASLENNNRGVFEMGADAEHYVDRTVGRAEIGPGDGDKAGEIWKTIAAQSGSPSARLGDRDGITELEFSSTRERGGGLQIQQVVSPSAGAQRTSYPPDSSLSDHNQRAFSANSFSTGATDSNEISPALTSTTFDRNSVVSPLLSGGMFSTTPLMGRDPRPSVGDQDPRATVQGPLNWPILAANRNSSTLTSATGWESKYLSPEMAMSNGFSAGDEVAKDANMAPENRDSGSSDAAFLTASRAPR